MAAAGEPCSHVPKWLDTLLARLVNIVSDGHEGDARLQDRRIGLLLEKTSRWCDPGGVWIDIVRFGIVRAVGFRVFL